MNKCWCGNEMLEKYSEDYFCCKNCETLISRMNFTQQIVDVQDEEHDLYGMQYWQKGMLEKAKVDNLEELHQKYLTGRVPYWFEHLLKFLPLGGNIVEVGCGLGDLSYILDRAGFFVEAFEISKDNCEYIKSKFNINIICDEFINQREELDAIIFIDVYEHLVKPKDFLKNCADSISEKGILCLQTPCYNPQISFEEIEKTNMNFKKLLVPEEHVYLFSKKSIEKSLKENGFNFIQFVPAFFGDDYDMFIFASKQPLKSNSQEEITDYLGKISNGELLKSWLSLFKEKNQLEKWRIEADSNSKKQLTDIKHLTKEVNLYKETCEKRLSDLQKLNKQVNENEKIIEVLNMACEERLCGIDKLTDEINQKNKQVEELNVACEERLRGIEELTSQIHQKNKQIEELIVTCEERLNNINILTELVDSLKND